MKKIIENYYKTRYWLGKKKKYLSEKFFALRYFLSENVLKNNSRNRLLSFKNLHDGKRCFIVGNGPSLNKMNLNLLKNEYCFIFNGAYSLRKIIEPKKIFHVVEDRLVLDDNINEINSLQGNVFLPSDLQNKIFSKNPIICHFQRADEEKSENWPNFVNCSTDDPIFYWGGTVAYFGLQLAAWMGFQKIYIIGVDLTYQIPDSAIRKGSILESTEDDVNHFEKSYFGKGKKWHVPQPDRMQYAFKNSVKPLESLNIKTYNAGVGGNLSAYERKDFKEILSE